MARWLQFACTLVCALSKKPRGTCAMTCRAQVVKEGPVHAARAIVKAQHSSKVSYRAVEQVAFLPLGSCRTASVLKREAHGESLEHLLRNADCELKSPPRCIVILAEMGSQTRGPYMLLRTTYARLPLHSSLSAPELQPLWSRLHQSRFNPIIGRHIARRRFSLCC
jgi:hypothetical protein